MIVKKTPAQKAFDVFNHLFMLFLIFLTVYPLLYVLFASISDPKLLMGHTGFLWKPLGTPTIEGYKMTLNNPNVLVGYRNTLFYVIFGTLINLSMTSLGAYCVTRKRFAIKTPMLIMVTITMFFSGGLVPTYMTISALHLISTKTILILFVAVNTYNLIIARTFIENSIPEDLYEAAVLDGCSHFAYFTKVVIPLSKAVNSVLILYYAVFHWNDYFNALVYNSKQENAPLQIVLREILLLNQAFSSGSGGVQGGYGQSSADQVKYAVIIVSTLPILCVYPFVQKYFEKGVMIGAVKG